MSFGLIGSEARKLKQRAVQQALLAKQAPAVAPVDTVVPAAQTVGGKPGGMMLSERNEKRNRRQSEVPTVATEASRLGAFMRGPSALPAPVAGPVDDGGIFRFFGYKPDETGQELGEWLISGRETIENAKNDQLARQEADAAERRRVQQEAEAKAQRQRQRQEIVQLMGPQAGIAYDQNPTEFGKMVSERYGTNLMSQGQTLDRGIDVPGSRYTADVFGNNEGVLYQQSGDGTVKQTKLQQSDDDANNAAETAEDIRNNSMTNSRGLAEIGVSRDRLNFDMDEAERKAVNGDPEFNAAQNARIYSDAMDAADAAMKNQGRLDTIARAALQFVENSKNYNSQGEGWWNDLGQALSMDTTGLKQLTDTIAPLIREPGSGGNSDADVNMFKSSVVSINNTKQANVNFANGAQALAGRNKEFVTYLSDAIDPNDPKSRQNANKIWLAYTEENPLYDPKTGELKSPPKFKDWLDIKTGRAVAPVTTSPMQMRTDRGSETIPAQSWSATTSGSARPVPTASTAPMGLRGGSGGGGGGQMGLTPAAPRPIQSQQPPPGIDPEDWKYFTPEMKQQYLAGRGQ